MVLVRAVWLFVSNAVWRLGGLRAAARVLVRALGSKDETTRTIAGMLLVRAGQKSEPLLQEELDKRENLPVVLTVIGSIGDPKFEAQLRRFSHDSDPDVAKAAKDALHLIEAHRTLA
ncbi:MAG: hypothetical protein WAU45_20585 [Blastocatellia bacterium]